jgi:prepilin-type N-terminal cleavage/methylation domain-containing protein
MKGRAGFSLIEVLTALTLTLVLSAVLVTLVHSQSRLVGREMGAADLQQSVRSLGAELARVATMSGRGGLPGSIAVQTRNNVPEGTRIGGPQSPEVQAGSDVLIVRGVFEGSLGALAAAAERETGIYELELRTPGPLGQEQDLGAFEDLAEEGPGEAVALAAGPGAGVAILELVEVAVEPGPGGGAVAVTLTVREHGSELADAYRQLADSTNPRLDPARAVHVGLLEEYRFYVRLSPDPFGGEERLRLARARFYPGSERVHPSSPGAADDLVDHALDLQVALGYDLDLDGGVLEGEAASGRSTDEWLGNAAGDDPEDDSWQATGPLLVRVSGWLRSARARVGYVAPARAALEDRLYEESEAPAAGEQEKRRFPRQRFRNVVRRRNP